VALCGHPGDDFHADASFADAHLIAAAPALLEACRVALRLSSWAVLSEVTSSAHSHSERRADEYDAKVRAAEDQIRAAIAKAEGAALSAARPAPTEGDS
jgi:hypothetical protein